MPTATMTSKGQITVPKEVRDELNLEPGSRVVFVRTPRGAYQIVPRSRNVMDLVEADSIEFEDGEAVFEALIAAEEGADYPDALIAASHAALWC